MAAARAATLLQPHPRQAGATHPLWGQSLLEQSLQSRSCSSLQVQAGCQALSSCGTAGLDTSPQHSFWRRARALDQGGHCQGALHLSQEKGWEILKAIDPCCVLLLSFYLRTFAKISAFSLIPVFQQQLWLC